LLKSNPQRAKKVISNNVQDNMDDRVYAKAILDTLIGDDSGRRLQQALDREDITDVANAMIDTIDPRTIDLLKSNPQRAKKVISNNVQKNMENNVYAKALAKAAIANDLNTPIQANRDDEKYIGYSGMSPDNVKSLLNQHSRKLQEIRAAMENVDIVVFDKDLDFTADRNRGNGRRQDNYELGDIYALATKYPKITQRVVTKVVGTAREDASDVIDYLADNVRDDIRNEIRDEVVREIEGRMQTPTVAESESKSEFESEFESESEIEIIDENLRRSLALMTDTVALTLEHPNLALESDALAEVQETLAVTKQYSDLINDTGLVKMSASFLNDHQHRRRNLQAVEAKITAVQALAPEVIEFIIDNPQLTRMYASDLQQASSDISATYVESHANLGDRRKLVSRTLQAQLIKNIAPDVVDWIIENPDRSRNIAQTSRSSLNRNDNFDRQKNQVQSILKSSTRGNNRKLQAFSGERLKNVDVETIETILDNSQRAKPYAMKQMEQTIQQNREDHVYSKQIIQNQMSGTGPAAQIQSTLESFNPNDYEIISNYIVDGEGSISNYPGNTGENGYIATGDITLDAFHLSDVSIENHDRYSLDSDVNDKSGRKLRGN